MAGGHHHMVYRNVLHWPLNSLPHKTKLMGEARHDGILGRLRQEVETTLVYKERLSQKVTTNLKTNEMRARGCPISQEHLLVPAPAWWFPTINNSSPRKPNNLF